MDYDKMCMIPGYAYVPTQRFSNVYDAEKALERGTVFAALDISMEQYGKEDLSECENYIKEADK